MGMKEIDAWTGFNTHDDNQDPGGSWLYAMRYSEENLREHQDSVISTIQGIGVTMHQSPDGGLYLGSEHDLSEAEMQKLLILAEELTVTNEALEHSALKLYGKSVEDLARMYQTAFLGSISTGNTEAAGGMLRVEMPGLVSDLSRAQADNGPLSEKDYKAVVDLGDFVANKTAALMGGVEIAVVTNFGPTHTFGLDDLPNSF